VATVLTASALASSKVAVDLLHGVSRLALLRNAGREAAKLAACARFAANPRVPDDMGGVGAFLSRMRSGR
jgi:hypothetical protein